jgi:hypothetical protein
VRGNEVGMRGNEVDVHGKEGGGARQRYSLGVSCANISALLKEART